MKRSETMRVLSFSLIPDLIKIVLDYCPEKEYFQRQWKISGGEKQLFSWSPKNELYVVDRNGLLLNVYNSSGSLLRRGEIPYNDEEWEALKHLVINPKLVITGMAVSERRIYLITPGIYSDKIKVLEDRDSLVSLSELVITPSFPEIRYFPEVSTLKWIDNVAHDELIVQDRRIYFISNNALISVCEDLENKILENSQKELKKDNTSETNTSKDNTSKEDQKKERDKIKVGKDERGSIQSFTVSKKEEIYLLKRIGYNSFVLSKDDKVIFSFHNEQHRVSQWAKIKTHNDLIYVYDMYYGEVYIFSKEGSFLRNWQLFQGYRPYNAEIAISPRGEIAFYNIFNRTMNIFEVDLE